MKMAKVKDWERILKAAKEKQRVIYKGTPTGLSTDFSAEILRARREWRDLFNVLKEEISNQGYSAQQDFHLGWKERELRQAKMKELVKIKPTLKEISKDL